MLGILAALFSTPSYSLPELPVIQEKIVAVIDTGLNIKDTRFKHLCKIGHKDFTGTGLEDTHGHGTHIAGIIDRDLPAGYCIVIIKFFDPKMKNNSGETTISSIKYAVDIGSKFVNESSSGKNGSEEEKMIYQSHPEITFIVAAGNDGKEITYKAAAYPAFYSSKNVIPVGNLSKAGGRAPSSNFGSKVQAWEIGTVDSFLVGGKNGEMSGTSQATAVHTVKVIRGLSAR